MTPSGPLSDIRVNPESGGINTRGTNQWAIARHFVGRRALKICGHTMGCKGGDVSIHESKWPYFFFFFFNLLLTSF